MEDRHCTGCLGFGSRIQSNGQIYKSAKCVPAWNRSFVTSWNITAAHLKGHHRIQMLCGPLISKRWNHQNIVLVWNPGIGENTAQVDLWLFWFPCNTSFPFDECWISLKHFFSVWRVLVAFTAWPAGCHGNQQTTCPSTIKRQQVQNTATSTINDVRGHWYVLSYGCCTSWMSCGELCELL